MVTQLIDPPEPGVHEKILDEVYHSWEGMSSHRLWDIHPKGGGKTLERLRWEMLHPESDKESEAKKLGTATHYALLEPDILKERVVQGLTIDRRSKKNKETWGAFELANKGRVVLKPESWKKLHGHIRGVRKVEAARKLLGAEGPTELSLVWVDPLTGAKCKARVDKYIPELCMGVDIKTTRQITLELFEKDATNMGYYFQGAHYLDGLNKCGMECHTFAFIVIETEVPHFCRVHTLTDIALDAGLHEVREAKQILGPAYLNNQWTGYGNEILPLNLSPWKMRQLMRPTY